MKSLFNKLGVENIIGTFFAIIAVIAIFYEMNLAGFTNEAIASGIKDLAGTVVTIIVMFVAIKALKPKKDNSFEAKLESKLNAFIKDNQNMIYERPHKQSKFEKENDINLLELAMQTNFEHYFGTISKGENSGGQFALLPLIKKENYENGNFTIQFKLNKGTFFGKGNELGDKPQDFKLINSLIRAGLAKKYASDDADITKGESDQFIMIRIMKPIVTEEDMDWIISMLDEVYKSYLVLGDSGLSHMPTKADME